MEIGVGTLATLALAAGIYRAYDVHVRCRFAVVIPGELYRSGAMPATRLRKTVERYGIRTVIDLRRPGIGVDAERETLKEVGVHHVQLRSGQVPRDEVLARYLELVREEAARPVLVHCTHGRGRSILFAQVFLMECKGFSPRQALASARWRAWFGNFNASTRKGGFIRSYTRRLTAPHPAEPSGATPRPSGAAGDPLARTARVG